jgi:hypothetical protein
MCVGQQLVTRAPPTAHNTPNICLTFTTCNSANKKIQVFTKVENVSIGSRARKPLHCVCVTLTLEWGSWKWYATLRPVMVHVWMKYRQIILSRSKVMAQTSQKWPYLTFDIELWPWSESHESGMRHSVYWWCMGVWCIKCQIMLSGSKVPDKQTINGQTDGRTDGQTDGQTNRKRDGQSTPYHNTSRRWRAYTNYFHNCVDIVY